jgi:hypothetical protein
MVSRMLKKKKIINKQYKKLSVKKYIKIKEK